MNYPAGSITTQYTESDVYQTVGPQWYVDDRVIILEVNYIYKQYMI